MWQTRVSKGWTTNATPFLSRVIFTFGNGSSRGCCVNLRACDARRREGDMNSPIELSEVGMTRLTLREHGETDLLGRVAEEIGQLPGVLRVRTNPLRQEIEIVFKQP